MAATMKTGRRDSCISGIVLAGAACGRAANRHANRGIAAADLPFGLLDQIANKGDSRRNRDRTREREEDSKLDP